MSEYIVKVNEIPTITCDGWSVRCDDLFIQREGIVRCKNCRFKAKDGEWCYRTDHEFAIEPNGFCAWGELKYDEE